MFAQRVLILVPHPDDEVVGCTAAILRARAMGHHVYGLYLTHGIPPLSTFWPWARHEYPKRIEQRLTEAREVAEQLDLKIIGCMGFDSRTLTDYLAVLLRKVEAALIVSQATILWTPAYEGGHQDHDVTNFIAAHFREKVQLWEFSEYHFARAKVHSQKFIEPQGTEIVLSLTEEERQIKTQLLKRYQSEQGNLNYVKLEQEVFRPLVNYDYANLPHAGKLFYERFHWVPYHPRVNYGRGKEICQRLNAFRQMYSKKHLNLQAKLS